MEIRQVLELVPEPTRSLLILIVFASMRPGEVFAFRWKDCLPDRVVVDERVYDGVFDDAKTEAGDREVPLDRHGVILGALQVMWERNKDFIYAISMERKLQHPAVVAVCNAARNTSFA